MAGPVVTASDPTADCGRFRELAPEIALGLVAGHERAEAVAHLQDCPACRQHTARLGVVHDRLRALIPAAEPPVGFEQRVLDRLGITRRPQRQPRMSRWISVAAAAVVVVAAFAGGWATGTASRLAAQAPAVASPLVAGTRHVGDVVVSRDRPDFLSVYLDVAHPGRLKCELLRTDGSVAATETYESAGGTGWWGIDRPPGDVTRIRVSDEGGTVVAVGGLPRP
jgi:hypothetical protein